MFNVVGASIVPPMIPRLIEKKARGSSGRSRVSAAIRELSAGHPRAIRGTRKNFGSLPKQVTQTSWAPPVEQKTQERRYVFTVPITQSWPYLHTYTYLQVLSNYPIPFIGQDDLYLLAFDKWLSPEQLSDPLYRSGWLIFACILQVLSTYPIPFIGQDHWYLLVFYKSWAIIRYPLSVRMIDICLCFTSHEQLSNLLFRSGWFVVACILQVSSNYPIPFIGQDDWYLLVFCKSWAIIRCHWSVNWSVRS